MNFDIVRRNAAWIRFEKDVRTQTVSHAYLVCGEDDDLRASFLTLACLRILCPTACGECDTCRTVLNGNHPEIIRLDGNDKIKVEDLKAVTDELYIRPAIGDKKIFIIDNADLLSPQVQNKLLKTYEEPPAYLIIFLAAKHENSLLQTVRSRGKKLYLEDVPTALIAQELVDNGENEETAEIAAANRLKRTASIEQLLECEKPMRGRAARPVVVAGDMNADRWGRKFSEERLFALFDEAGFSNPLGDLPPGARGTHPSKKWGDSALDYVFLRGLDSVRLPHIEPNDGLSDHYALFTLVSPFSACLHSGVSFWYDSR